MRPDWLGYRQLGFIPIQALLPACLFLLLYPLIGCSQQPRTTENLETLVIRTAERDVRYRIEIAANDAARTQGLMYRRHLPEDQGMLFDFHTSQQVSFWMQNTYIPLDMLFIDSRGVIRKIVRNTEPLSTRSIPSDHAVRYVLEVNASQTERHGIQVGDSLLLPQ